MFRLSERCEYLRDLALRHPGHDRAIDGQHQYWFAKGFYGVPADKRNRCSAKAAMLESMLLHCEPYIADRELIAGYTLSSSTYSDSLHYPVPIGSDEQERGVREMFADTLLTGAQIEEYIALMRKNDPPFPSIFDGDWGKKTEYSLSADEIALCEDYGAMGHCTAINHSIIGYEYVARLGFSGLLEKINACAAVNGESEFYRCVRTVCEAACGLGERWAARARELSAACEDAARRRELIIIAETCEVVPRYPARNFRQAIQAIWFAHCLNAWEDGINANSLGRLDQILYPYYKNDIGNGSITREEAFELVCCLWLKLYRDYDVQQCCVGGCDVDGRDAVNELSYIMLDATEALGFVRDLSVRYGAYTDKKFVRRALQTVGKLKKGIPFFFNDDVIIPALSEHGIAERDARDYAALGCVEINIPGKAHNHAVVGQVNMLKPAIYALTGGRSLHKPGHFSGYCAVDPKELDTFDKYKDAVKAYMRRAVSVTCKSINNAALCAAGSVIAPVKSLLTEGCLERGRDFNDGGPDYVYYQVCLIGLPNLIDSLMAIKTLVYERGKYTLDEILCQLRENFPDETVRLDLINNAPKYGNDDAEVTSLAAELYAFACDCVNGETPAIGCAFHAEPFSFLWMIDHGRNTGASPDGRRDGEIMAYSMSPMQGRDKNGFTALLNSITGVPTKKAPGASSAIVELDPFYFSEENLDMLTDLFLAASREGLSNTQFNIVDRETLVDAKLHPEKYPSLAVRVSGFSQKFVLLSPELQDHIIARTKHASL